MPWQARAYQLYLDYKYHPEVLYHKLRTEGFRMSEGAFYKYFRYLEDQEYRGLN